MPNPAVTQTLLDDLAPSNVTYQNRYPDHGYFLGKDGAQYFLYPVSGTWEAHAPSAENMTGYVQHYCVPLTGSALQYGTLGSNGTVVYNGITYAITSVIGSGGSHVAKAVAQ